MKFLALLLVIGCASATFYDALDHVSDEVVLDFVIGMEQGPALKEVIGAAYADETEQIENDIKTELGKALKKSLDDVLSKIRKSVDHGKEIAKELLEKAKDIAEKLKDLGQDAGQKAKELVEKIKEKAREFLKKILEKINISKRGLAQLLIERLNLGDVIESLKEKILQKWTPEAFKNYILRIFGDSSIGQSVLKIFEEKGGYEKFVALLNLVFPSSHKEVEVSKNHVEKRWIIIAKAACMLIKYMANGWTASKIQNWINNNVEPKWQGTLSAALKYGFPALRLVLGRFCYAAAPAGPTDYSLVELWQKVKDFFKDAGVEIQARFFQFASWLKGVVNDGVRNMQDKIEKLKEIAKQVVESGKTLSKEAAEEALEFFRPYREDLGSLWEQIVETVRSVVRGSTV